jgi:hypothetical protein
MSQFVFTHINTDRQTERRMEGETDIQMIGEN